jgi:methionine synthase I (cobalamin-dependent)
MELKKAPLLFDGAFGTYYQKISGKNAYCEQACIDEPETVLRIHREYIAAGARAVKTNTFGANRPATGPDTEKIIAAGFSLARKAASEAARPSSRTSGRFLQTTPGRLKKRTKRSFPAFFRRALKISCLKRSRLMSPCFRRSS